MSKTHTISIDLIPDINSLKSQLMNIPLNPNELLVFPTFGSLPDPLYGSISLPDLEIQKFVIDLVNQQLFTNILNLARPLLSLLQRGFSVFPKVPFLNIGLDELLTMDSKALEDKIIHAIESGITIPYIDNVYRSLEVAELAASQILARIKVFYAFDCIQVITDLIDSALDKLNINATLILPSLIVPNFAEIEAAFRESFNSAIDLNRITSGIGISLAGEFEWHQYVTETMSYINGVLLKKIMEFCQSTLGMLGFSFYKISVSVSVVVDYNFPMISIDDPFK